MTNSENVIFLPCDDHAEAFEFSITNFDDNTNWCELNFFDSYCGHKESKLISKLKRAWKAFTGEPIYYTGVVVEDIPKARKFFEDCINLIDRNGESK